MASSIEFALQHSDPEFVQPENPASSTREGEGKQLSDIDDQQGLRFHVSIIMFYPNNALMKGKDPAKVVKEAFGKALVYYYPFAGRIIEEDSRKLMVDCANEGVLFIEADADTTLEDLGDAILNPCVGTSIS